MRPKFPFPFSFQMHLPRRLLPWTLLCLLTAVLPSRLTAMSLAGRQNRREFMESVKQAFLQEDYATLEATAADLRARKDRFPDGVWTLPAFYDALELGAMPQPVATTFEERLFRWKASQPRSVAARIVEANAIQSSAWTHQGALNSLLSPRALLDEAEHFEPTPPADWFSAMVRLALRQAWDRADFDRLFDRAVAAEPDYLSYYFNRANYLFSYGQPGEWEAFALDAGRKNISGEGMGIYSRIAWSLADGRTDNFLAQYTAIQWPLMRDGFRELDRLWPNSDWNLNNFCRFACLAGDRETAHELFARIGDRWTTNWLSHKAFQDWAAWADAREDRSHPPTWRFVLDDDDQPLAWTIRFAPDGGSLYAGYDHARVVRWNLTTGAVQWRGDLGADGSIDGLDISPDAHWLAAGTGSRNRQPNVSGAVGIWDLHAQPPTRAPAHRLEDLDSGVHGLKFSPDGRTLAAAGYNQVVNVFGELRLWSVPEWKELRHVSDLPISVLGLSFVGAQGQRLAFTSAAAFNVVETATWAHVFWPDHALHPSSVRALSVSPDGQTLACATADGYEDRDRPGEVTFWSTTDWSRRETPHIRDAGGVGSLAYSPNGRWLLTGTYDGFLRVWDTATGKVAAAFPPDPKAGKINAVAFAPDNGRVACVRDDGAISVYPFAAPATPPPK